ncbi:ester cyclase [Nocardioides sp. MAHUQ-72]|uniref:ester cyclase n=1 Tax=unclassified Nocardioides TaxID=2615069 RepID=UPI003607B675
MPHSETPIPQRLIGDFYGRVWNAWDAEAALQLLHPGLTFRGSLGRHTRGVAEFLEYVADVRVAFPDFHNEVTDLVVDVDQAVARLTYTGTHCGPVLGRPATGRRISYEGIAWFRVDAGRISSVFVLGDVDRLRDQLQPVPDAKSRDAAP